jgi:hypothetical protein
VDASVAFVQAYLHVNGYFTVVEYPVLEAARGQPARTVTDLDILAFRFAGAGHSVIRGRRRSPGLSPLVTDPILRCPSDRPDMIVGEVKEGAARFNAAMRDPAVIAVALARFGCCPPEHAPDVTQQLLARGHTVDALGHSIRLVAFGDTPDSERPAVWTTVPMRHIVRFLRRYLREHWTVLRHAQIKDPVLSLLALIEKWGVDATEPPNTAALAPGKSGRGAPANRRR